MDFVGSPEGDTLERVRRVVADGFGIPLAEVTPETDVLDILTEGPLAVVELTLALEKELGITLPDHLEGARTVGEVAAVVERWREAASVVNPGVLPGRQE